MSTHVYKNIFFLCLVQFSNYISPLLVLPYLSRIIGLDGFGLIMMAVSLSSICALITDYGFGLSASYWIAKNRNDKAEVAHYLSAIFFIKAILFIFVVLVLFLYFLFGNGILHKQPISFLMIGLMILSQTFQVTWFFQGIERMRGITIITAISKITYLASVFLFIKQSDQVIDVLMCMVLSNFVATVVSIYAIYREKYYITRPSFNFIKSAFKQSSEFFISRAAVSIYTSACTFIIGTYGGATQAAIYSSAEKLYQAGQGVTSPVSQALYPYLARTGDSRLLYRFIGIIVVPLIIGCSVCSYYAQEILLLFYGSEFVSATTVLRVFLICSVVNFIAVMFGYPAFASVGRNDIPNRSVILGGGVQLIFVTILYSGQHLTSLTLVLSVLVTELFVMFYRVLSLYSISRSTT